MHEKTYYAATARDTKGFAQLNEALDVAIIGGATGRNGGQITGSLSGDIAMAREFRRTVGEAADDVVWETRWRGHDIIKNRIKKYSIACDLVFGHLQTGMKPAHMEELKGIHAEAQRRGMDEDLELIDGKDIPNYFETEM